MQVERITPDINTFTKEVVYGATVSPADPQNMATASAVYEALAVEAIHPVSSSLPVPASSLPESTSPLSTSAPSFFHTTSSLTESDSAVSSSIYSSNLTHSDSSSFPNADDASFTNSDTASTISSTSDGALDSETSTGAKPPHQHRITRVVNRIRHPRSAHKRSRSDSSSSTGSAPSLSRPPTPPNTLAGDLSSKLEQMSFDRQRGVLSPDFARSTYSTSAIPTTTPTPFNTPDQSDLSSSNSQGIFSADSTNGDFDDDETTDPITVPEGDIEALERTGELPPSIQIPADLIKSNVRKVVVIYNPMSGAKKGEKIMKLSRKIFEESSIEVTQIATTHKNHCEELFLTMDFSPFDVVCLIGGDGTVHEGVNGIMKRQVQEGMGCVPPLGIIPGGTGNSFVLELQEQVKVRKALTHICRGVHAPIDIFKISLPHPNSDMAPEEIYSFNSVHWGLASKVNVTAERMRWMGKAIRYTSAALLELIHGKGTFAKVILEDKDGNITEYNEEFCLAIANNIRTAAKGMKMAPNAFINDGLVDLLLIRSHKTRNLMHVFSRVYQGTHTELSYVEYKQVKRFSITPYAVTGQVADAEMEIAEELIDIDGELKGSTPFECTVLDRSLRVLL